MTNVTKFYDAQLGKKTSFSFPRPLPGYPNNIAGIFSYNGYDGLLWNGLLPCSNEDKKPSFECYDDAINEYYMEDYFELNFTQKTILWEKHASLCYERNGKFYYSANDYTLSLLKKNDMPVIIVRKNLHD